MKDYITLGSAPCEETCVQVSPNVAYLDAMRAECRRYLDCIRATCGPEVGSARLGIKTFPHDFGSYIEVVCHFDDTDDVGMAYAFACERNAPTTWGDIEKENKA